MSTRNQSEAKVGRSGAVAPRANNLALVGLILGLVSVVLHDGIMTALPVLAVVFGIVGLTQVAGLGGRGKLQALVGILSGVIFTVISLWAAGHIGAPIARRQADGTLYAEPPGLEFGSVKRSRRGDIVRPTVSVASTGVGMLTEVDRRFHFQIVNEGSKRFTGPLTITLFDRSGVRVADKEFNWEHDPVPARRGTRSFYLDLRNGPAEPYRFRYQVQASAHKLAEAWGYINRD